MYGDWCTLPATNILSSTKNDGIKEKDRLPTMNCQVRAVSFMRKNLVVSNIFFMFIPKIGEDTHFWRAYFSKGVGETPPSSNLQVLIWSPFLLLRLWSSAALASCVSWLCVGWCITLRWVVKPILPCSTWEGLGKVGVGCWVGRLVGCTSFLRWIWFNLPVWDVYYA